MVPTARPAGAAVSVLLLALTACSHATPPRRDTPPPAPTPTSPAPRSPFPTASARATYAPPRPVGEPLFVSSSVPPLPDAPDLTFAMRVEPYHGISVGDRITFRVVIGNRAARPARDVGASILVGDGALVRVVRAPGGTLNEICDQHDPASGKHRCRHMGVEFRDVAVPAGRSVTLTLVVRVLDFACPGGGDFVHEALATIFGPVKRGPNGGRHYLWYENDPSDYRGKDDRPVRPEGCYSESITD